MAQHEASISTHPAGANKLELVVSTGDSAVLVKIAASGDTGRFNFKRGHPAFFTIPDGGILEFRLPPHTDLWVSSGTVDAVSVLLLPPTAD